MNSLTQSTAKKQPRIPICKSCLTPMKGHLKTGGKKGRCRPNLWVDHGDNHKEHGGKYEWEKQRWNGTEWKTVEVVSIAKNEVVVQTLEETPQNLIVPIEKLSMAPPPGTCPERDEWLAFLRDSAEENESDSESDNESENESDNEAEPVPVEDEHHVPLRCRRKDQRRTDREVKRDALHHGKEGAKDEKIDPEEPKDEWKPLADRYWWNYYRNWQKNSTYVKFPTLAGMTGPQLGDIMENYGKYREFYDT